MRNQEGSISSSGGRLTEENEEDEISSLQAREEEIERKKMEVKERVDLQLGRAEEESRRLTRIREELELLGDPLRKEVAMVRKKIDMANRELKSLGQTCQKKEKEHKEALEAFDEKNKEKARLVAALMESLKTLAESESLRMKKLEELSKNIESIH